MLDLYADTRCTCPSPLIYKPAPSCARRQDLAVLDLYAGCGGLSEGLHRKTERVEIATKWAVDYDACMAATFRANNPHATVGGVCLGGLLPAPLAPRRLSHGWVVGGAPGPWP